MPLSVLIGVSKASIYKLVRKIISDSFLSYGDLSFYDIMMPNAVISEEDGYEPWDSDYDWRRGLSLC